MNLSSKQRAYLSSLASTINPIFNIGKASLTPEIIEARVDRIFWVVGKTNSDIKALISHSCLTLKKADYFILKRLIKGTIWVTV